MLSLDSLLWNHPSRDAGGPSREWQWVSLVTTWALGTGAEWFFSHTQTLNQWQDLHGRLLSERIGFKLQISRQELNCKFNWPEINHFLSHQTKRTFFLSRKENKNSFRKSTILYRKLAHRFFYKTQNLLLTTPIRILFPVSFVYSTRQAA